MALGPHEQDVELVMGRHRLQGILGLPDDPKGIVLFAHGSGSGRLSPRNRFVARHLQQGRIATLLIDLLEESEAEDRRNVFDTSLLASRVRGATDWLTGQSRTARLRIGYFGASTGTGAALQAAAEAPGIVDAVVSRGGRPDLAATYLPSVTAPTLLIVGGDDETVVELNRDALALLTCRKKLVIVPGASHLFEEPGMLEQVATLALGWFQRYLAPSS
ncbi:MAG: dienelactone hydrolase family protein [Nitrospiraceae bacterium]